MRVFSPREGGRYCWRGFFPLRGGILEGFFSTRGGGIVGGFFFLPAWMYFWRVFLHEWGGGGIVGGVLFLHEKRGIFGAVLFLHERGGGVFFGGVFFSLILRFNFKMKPLLAQFC